MGGGGLLGFCRGGGVEGAFMGWGGVGGMDGMGMGILWGVGWVVRLSFREGFC